MKTAALAFLLVPGLAAGVDIPPAAKPILPLLLKTQQDVWPGIPYKSYLPAQIEQETCPSLKSSKCWNPRTELKTDREYGFGFSQLTVAYNKDGSVRFNAWEEIKQKDSVLKHWTWDQRFDPEMQIRALVTKNYINWKTLPPTITNTYQKMKFLAVTYNGGSTYKDRMLCSNTKGCNPNLWDKNVELTSYKSRVPFKGYSKSAYQISREYPQNIMDVRRPKYVPYTGE